MHRPRHSLSVSIVRRRGNSLASSPVTSGSYSSLNQSPAVSFLASLADMSVAQEPVRGEYHEGDQVGDFLLGPEIGVGAFSHVFEAEVIDGPHKHLGKVAVKVVIKNQPSEEGSKDLQRLIEHETTVWARLRHPHVLEMLELMDADDAVFVVSELVTGGNLLDHIRAQGHLTEENARKIFRQVASALRYLHDEIQVVHRDVKCENILLDSNGNAKLADFGLSADMTPEAPISGSPILPELSVNGDPVFLMGSIHYCAPEELRKTTKCNAASDLWSLGVVLYAMLTGGLPFNDGFMPRLQMMIQNGRWDQAKLDAAGCSAAAKEVVRGLLRPKAAERWGSNELWASDWLKGTSE
ncbi:kinase-like domain-containing protein [Powellomyces hirtus]|nr:kinase-like domain-containing protein [Powellomyces hirtus]